ncbi:unnamed protein product [Didymodactylos carnosus]|uniref:Uncharacterized protein n=1 Tax=Didymodactylos carnosus TaxID=1234261 RepID=A0A814GCA8_9BILA|nr:unnamed protein product [Didymodactylos carnosus]CAF3764474.1 unnamed protein product [Didymodactylos carnosus]
MVTRCSSYITVLITRKNIAYGDHIRQIPMIEIIEAAKKANIHDFIQLLPQTWAPKMRGKWVITNAICKDIMNVLKQDKAGGKSDIDPQHRKTVVMLETLYHILHEAHEQTGYGGRDNM